MRNKKSALVKAPLIGVLINQTLKVIKTNIKIKKFP